LEHNNGQNHFEIIARDIKLAPGEIAEMLGKPPAKAYLYGGAVVVFVLAILIFISFIIPYQENIDVRVQVAAASRAGDTSGITQPENKEAFVVTGDAPTINAGHLLNGQHVNISLDAFPSGEYGLLEGSIVKIAPFDAKKTVRIDIRLMNGMKTNKDIVIPAQPYLEGSGKVVIRTTSYFKRIFNF
jgi:hypothetical protein